MATSAKTDTERPNGQIKMKRPSIVSPEEWEASRQQLLVKEKALTRSRDALATWFGPKVEETTFEDYRDLNGVKLPYLIITHTMEDQQLFKISAIQINIDVDPAWFEPPKQP